MENNVYLTAVEHNGIMRMRPDGTLETLVKEVTLDTLSPEIDIILAGKQRGRVLVNLKTE